MIPDQKVILKWHNQNKKHYIEKGYIYTKSGDEFEVDINDMSGSYVLVRFICDFCKGENQTEEKDKYAQFNNLKRNRENEDCCNHKDCKSKKASKTHLRKPIPLGESLLEKFPELAKEFNEERNKIKPINISSKSAQKMWWKCSKGHEWESKVCNRTNGRTCPYCLGRKICEDNCLSTLRPDISIEWNFERNTILPTDVGIGYGKKIWWKCKNNHEWESTVNNRTNHDNGCPYCSNKKVNNENAFINTHPELAKEWSYRNKLTPYEVTYGSKKTVIWECSKCNYEWENQVTQRTIGRGCPQCAESKGERKVREFLNLHNISCVTQKEFNNLRGINGGFLKFDFAIFADDDMKLLIEYDGAYHFGKLYENDGYEKMIIHDALKNKFCKENNIPLLRIPYWEFDSIESILKDELIKYNLLTSD